MSHDNTTHNLQELLDLNEYGFYTFMPESDVVRNELGYFVKNRAIETYSYATPTLLGEEDFESFLNFTFSFFSGGKEYIIIKHAYDEFYQQNSKIMRQKQLIGHHIDIGVMYWEPEVKDKLIPSSHVEYELLSTKDIKKWVDVFFDAFAYPNNLRKYITSMAKNQSENGIKFYVGYVAGKDTSCFCSYFDGEFRGLYGVGTRYRYRRRGYAATLMSNYICDTLNKDNSAKFCLQVHKKSGAELLYTKLGFKEALIQKRFDWDPSIFI